MEKSKIINSVLKTWKKILEENWDNSSKLVFHYHLLIKKCISSADKLNSKELYSFVMCFDLNSLMPGSNKKVTHS